MLSLHKFVSNFQVGLNPPVGRGFLCGDWVFRLHHTGQRHSCVHDSITGDSKLSIGGNVGVNDRLSLCGRLATCLGCTVPFTL